MTALLTLLSYALVLLYGSLLAIDFAGGCITLKKQKMAAAVIGIILIVQIISVFFLDINTTTQIYPFISHLPLVFFIVLCLKKSVGIAAVSVVTAYFCCQLPNWLGNVAQYLFHIQTSYFIAYTISIIVFFILIRRFFIKPVHRAMTYSKQSLFLFGCLPLFYYLFDYATTVYTDALYQGIIMVNEFLPAAMVMFYILFIVMYHNEVQLKNKIEQDNTLLSMKLEQAANQIQNAQTTQELFRIYRHDLRHHLSLLNSFAEGGDMDKRKDYLAQAQSNVDEITPVLFCSNETVNLILSSFDSRAKKTGVKLLAEVNLPQEIPIPATELCAIFSNGLENALSAASQMEDPELRTMRVNCSINRDKLLILIQNPYDGKIQIENGIPLSSKKGHGFGCRSIAAISKKRNGFSTFKAEKGIFTLRVVLPMYM